MADLDVGFIQQALHGLARRQEAIANNIANAETPGYQRAQVPFEALLREQLSRQEVAGQNAMRSMSGGGELMRTNPQHLSSRAAGASAGPAAIGSELLGANVAAGGSRNDGNTVELDQEMTDLAITQVRYAGLSAALSARLRTLRSIVESA